MDLTSESKANSCRGTKIVQDLTQENKRFRKSLEEKPSSKIELFSNLKYFAHLSVIQVYIPLKMGFYPPKSSQNWSRMQKDQDKDAESAVTQLDTDHDVKISYDELKIINKLPEEPEVESEY